MHVALTAWKARSLLGEARSELRRGTRHEAIDPRLVAQLHRAEAAVSTALSALEELEHLRASS